MYVCGHCVSVFFPLLPGVWYGMYDFGRVGVFLWLAAMFWGSGVRSFLRLCVFFRLGFYAAIRTGVYVWLYQFYSAAMMTGIFPLSLSATALRICFFPVSLVSCSDTDRCISGVVYNGFGVKIHICCDTVSPVLLGHGFGAAMMAGLSQFCPAQM